MEGINGTVFAYGQTASGKTYTMMGVEEQPGVIPQAVEDVFNYIREEAGDREFLLRVSYLEIYNETIRDLLSPEIVDVRIHEDRKRGVYVSPLKEEIVTTPKQVMKVIQRGEQNRHFGSTDYNEHSSRSHTIFQMVRVSPSTKLRGAVTISQLNLIDLAGSEKATTDLDRRKEGSFINKSLLTLGNVISKLTEEKGGHIPFRDSKLTRILQPSLSGNANIAVVCTVSPAAGNYDETLNTLKFAARVKRVTVNAKANQVLDDKALLQKYRNEIMQLKTQMQEATEMVEQVRQQDAQEFEQERQKWEEKLHESHLVCFRRLFVIVCAVNAFQ
ncbi:P-loop containing nucleoside triphosphate hydrolase protein [Cladochytrium replicatum]|nr:P-loop containing nucleoside triphosphate hydrolase protein [Cladochytrium replicatum]